MSEKKEKLDNYINYCEINDEEELNPLSFKERELFKDIYIRRFSSSNSINYFSFCGQSFHR